MYTEKNFTIDGKGKKIAIIAAKFNRFITQKLVEGAAEYLYKHNVEEKNIEVIWVPGAFEVPLAAKAAAKSNKYNAVITLGAVIRGSTAHFDFVAGQAAKGIMQVNLETEVPVIFGIITPDNIEQAIERAGTLLGNKGSEAAEAALETLSAIELIKK